MMSKRSWVWQHFKLISDNLSMCNICHKMFKAGRSTTPMIRHMKTAHGLENSESETGPNSSTSFLLSSPLSLLHVPPAPLYADTDDKKLKLDKALVDVVVKDLQPFSIVEDEGFRAYTKNLDPEYNLPNRKLLKKMVENAYEKKKQQVQQELNEALQFLLQICVTY
ncbi:PREDICTED: zinc finger BED domain-containing protein 4 [Dufourea novaeangliae]|uniref:zinc finger BED domain-containing protein 4 n=1 Tax=Dufourea novaeangliae TaxID=178035 RepID=UPI00076711E5|nr:PREDICTED: zinc finger BED domain-containing protein 4 [Dufourea novaeangliae]